MSKFINSLTIIAAKIDSVGDSNEKKLDESVTNILYAIIAALGLVAVAFIVVGGINYITSNGDASKVEKAKKTILYACIGLVICALSFAIVNFTISNILEQGSSSSSSSSSSSPDSYTTKKDCTNAGYKWKDKKCQEK